MRTGIFGGTFNPVHKGHLHLCRQIADAQALDRVLLIPTNLPPHKEAPCLASNAHRLEMLRLAAEADRRFAVSDIEYRLGQKSYTLYTLLALREEYPEDEFYLIVGSDMLLTFEQWHRYREILELAVLVAGARHPNEYAKLCEKRTELGEDRVVIVQTDVLDISSTELRRRLAADEPVSAWLEPAVEAYIRQHGLYGAAPSSLNEETLLADLKNRLSSHRMAHTLAVARLSEELARHYGADPAAARLAGLLHDYTKEEPAASQLQMLQNSDILVPVSEKLYHACTAFLTARDRFHITDPDLLNAVRYHTTGRAGMSLMEQIVFTADAISYDRTYSNAAELRALAFRDLDACTLEVLDFVLGQLQRQGLFAAPESLQCQAEFEQRVRRKPSCQSPENSSNERSLMQ